MFSEPPAPPFRVSHVLLDVDGTLVDYGTAMQEALLAAAERASAIAGEEIPADVLHRMRQAVMLDPEWRAASVPAQRREAIRRLLVAYGEDRDDSVRSVLDAYEVARDRTLTVFPDVPPALRAIAGLGVTMVAASNGNVDLGRVGLGEFISATHYAVDVGVAKPDPRFFSLALERFGVEPARALAVGDRLDNDYQPAVAGGLHAVLIDRTDAVHDASVRRIRALTELAGLIRPH